MPKAILFQLVLNILVASVHSFAGLRTSLCNSSIRSNVDGNQNCFLLSAQVNGNQDQDTSKAPDLKEIQMSNSRGDPTIPLVAFDVDPLPGESKASILNFEMLPYEYNRSTRILKGRSYARDTAFQKENMNALTTLQDLASPKQSNEADTFWSTRLFRGCVFLSAFSIFPPLLQFLSNQETIPLSMFGELTDNFSTGVSILYGTIISLTLNILYDRQTFISEQIATESSLLLILTRNTLALFRDDELNVQVVGKCISDQVRILVKESRGKELITLIYADPYGRLLDLLNNSEKDDSGRNEGLINSTRDIIKDIITSRSMRLSRESSGLPPTHFFILSLLTFIILLSNVLSTLSLLVEGEPPFESRLFFALFATVYVIFFNFATDLDNPFGGVYQIRRSAIAANLLQTKNLLLNEPLLKDGISFDENMPTNGSS